MNEIHEQRLLIEFYSWAPFTKDVERELNELIMKLKNKELLGHAGYVKTTLITRGNSATS